MNTTTSPKYLHSLNLHMCTGNLSVSCFGKPHDWQLKPFFENGDVTVLSSIAPFLRNEGIRVALVPRLKDFNAVMIPCHEMQERLTIGGVSFHYGKNAAGCDIPLGSAALFSTGDCFVLTVYNKRTGQISAAHCGLRELIHFPPEGEARTRGYESVIQPLLTQFEGCWRENLHLEIFAGIRPEAFRYPWTHPVHGKENQRLCEHIARHYGEECTPGPKAEGRIDLHAIITRQVRLASNNQKVVVRHDSDCTASNPQWWSHVRFTEGNEPTGVDGRNLVVVCNSPD